MTSATDDLLLNALADGELDAAASIALETRLSNEPALAAAYTRIRATKHAVTGLGRPVVAPEFHARIAALAPQIAPPQKRGWRLPGWPMGDMRAAFASFVLVACLASGVTYLLTAPGADTGVEEAVIAGHRRSLLASSPVDVASSDRHTVRPWFDAKLGLAPPTPDLSGVGFPLVGGRVEVIGSRTVPTLVYEHDKHLITVVAVPGAPGDAGNTEPRAFRSGGYNLVHWDRGGFRFWAVSDLDREALDRFVSDIRAD